MGPRLFDQRGTLSKNGYSDDIYIYISNMYIYTYLNIHTHNEYLNIYISEYFMEGQYIIH